MTKNDEKRVISLFELMSDDDVSLEEAAKIGKELRKLVSGLPAGDFEMLSRRIPGFLHWYQVISTGASDLIGLAELSDDEKRGMMP